jgi:hypothetical protein
MLHTHLSSVVDTVGQLVADVPSGLSLNPPHENNKNKKNSTTKNKTSHLQKLQI